MIMEFTQLKKLTSCESRTVKPQYSAIHLNTRSLNQHFEEMCNLLDSISCKFDFLNKYDLYRNKIAPINRIYRDRLYNDILTKSDDTKKMWDNINLLINKKRPSSHIEKLQVENRQYEQPFTISNCLSQQFFLYATSKALLIYYYFYLFNFYHFWPFLTRRIIQYIKCYISFPFFRYMACDAFSLLENKN